MAGLRLGSLFDGSGGFPLAGVRKKPMRVLVACEESQAVTIEMRRLGHEAYSCDLQACSGGHPEWHIQGDALPLIREGGWDMIIAHPPCTYLSNLGAKHLYMGTERVKRQNDVFRLMNEDRVRCGINARDFFFAMYNAPCPRVAVENPVPSSIWQLPRPSQMIQPWMFGDPYKKKTYLWLRGLPPLMATDIVVPTALWVDGGHGKTSRMQTFGFRDQKTRSKTFTGIARAMAEQWAGQVEEGEPCGERLSLFDMDGK
jgi:hypothetical protein